MFYLSPPCQLLLGIPTKLKLKQQLIVQQMTIMCRQRDPARLEVQTAWATLVSTPLIHSNRFEVLAVTDEEHSDDGNFREQRSARVKRRRLLSSLQKRRQNQQQQVTGNDQRNNQQQNSARRSRGPLVVGRSV